MNQSKKNWLSRPNVSPRWAIAAGVFWLLVLGALQGSSAGEYLDEKVAQPVDFRVREFLGQSPVVSKKLKILVLDDPAFAELDTWVLSIDQWAMLLKALDQAKPKSIFIDKLWSKVVDPNGRLEDSINTIKGLKTPITVAASASRVKVPFRYPLELDWPDFSLASRIAGGENIDASNAISRLPDYSKYYFSGPTYEVDPAIAHVGHIIYSGNGRVAPLIQADFATGVPHGFLYSADSWEFRSGGLFVNDHQLHLDREGYAPVNFFPHDASLYKNKTIMSLRYFINRARKGLPTKMINEGDSIVILPHFYTGNTDFKWTPFGYMPAGFIPAALTNSVLTGQWINPYGNRFLSILLAVVAGILLAFYSGVGSFWFSLIVGAIAYFSFSLAMFSYVGFQLSWLLPIFSFLGSSITVFSKKSRTSDLKTRALRHALEGAIRSEELDDILKNPAKIELEPRERIVTLVFVDIVGFSLISENMIPRRAFDSLKETLDQIAEVVHEFGGVIDKTLGDGLLCYFGYSFESDKSVPGHAEAALNAAIKIQRNSLAQTLSDFENKKPLMPLRIGVNTASSFLGDLGSGDRIEFTVIGNGVNFAKRLEGACEIHHVMLSGNTKELIKNISESQTSITRKQIKIKHHKNLVEAYDFNPFFAEPGIEKRAIEAFKSFQEVDRNTKRIEIQTQSPVNVLSDYGVGTFTNFSISGASLRIPLLLAKSVTLKIKIELKDPALIAKLEAAGVGDIQCEVRWSYREGAIFEHGIQYGNLSDEQKKALFECLTEFTEQISVSKSDDVAEIELGDSSDSSNSSDIQVENKIAGAS